MKKLLNTITLLIALALIIYACNRTSPPSDISEIELPSSANIHLTLGNPSNANTSDLNNYLMEKPEFAMAYNCDNGTANWVSWQLNQSWLGNTERQDDFRPDQDLPSGCYQVRPTDYRGSGYDRGHLTPSGGSEALLQADRTRCQQDNSATFVMSNMIPQSPENNREVWRELEQYSRELVNQGKELYIIAGGEGSKGKLAQGKVNIPQTTWKVILVIDEPIITEDTRVIAVQMPNSESVANTDWRDYRVSVDEIEAATGYDFLSNFPQDIQAKIESRIDQQ